MNTSPSDNSETPVKVDAPVVETPVAPESAATPPAPAVEVETAEPEVTKVKGARWYAIRVFSGSEDRVIANILEQAKKKELSDQFVELMAPKEQVEVVKRGVKKTMSKSFFAGYVLAHMVMNDTTAHLVLSVDRVAGFLGDKGNASPLLLSEVEALKGSVQQSLDKPEIKKQFTVGEEVKVTAGAFKGFTGLVESVSEDGKERLQVSVMVFGRPTPVEVGYGDVEKGQG